MVQVSLRIPQGAGLVVWQGDAIIAVEKNPFDSETLGALLGPQALLQVDFQNAEYGA